MGIKLQSSSGGSVEIAAPVTASNYVLTAPATTGIILNDQSSLAAANLTGNVDVARLVSAFSGSNVSLAANGYQKLPSGLIIQWGLFLDYTNATNISYPIAFPNAVFSVVICNATAYNTLHTVRSISNLAHFTAQSFTYSSEGAYFIALGY